MTESIRVSNAKGLYLEGIRDGKMAEALEKYTGDRYTQHSTGVRDGKEGFIEFFTPFLERNPVRDIQVVRTIEDGRFVFCHVYQSLNNGEAQWVTGDIFDTDDEGRIVEHWDVIAEYKWPTVSGRTMVDGPTGIEDLDQTKANKALVQDFAEKVLIDGRTDLAPNYISAGQYDQHNPETGDGLEGLAKHLKEVMRSGQAAQYVKIHRLLGEGNFVVIYSHVKQGGDDWAFFDLFRLKGGKIVEHWDIQEKIGPKETWRNSGKF
ncbi:nuclear transport factor 2 family protein [Leisingera sp. McT4-56]|uniref:nuclear transport factor 2 family protein n=1 Tax=Leisingera sp. McT4-56 TaxID=2881255 RepID=UPI001CF8E6A4|nr:nuclear transport factor 2 family protein [Leisingera sp. McT4-56]MCB4458394.1 nuclear transport factor 2 family protein [Leisingera sp. McT4-56]